MLALGQASLRAGRSLCCIDYFFVARCVDHCLCNKNLVADRAVLALGLAGFGASRLNSRINGLGVARCGDLFHTGHRSAADGALRTGRMTSLGAGSGLFRNINRGMPSRVDCFGLGCIANRAGVGLDTGILTGGSGRDLALTPAVAVGGNHFLFNNDFVANRAMLAFGQAGLGAGCRNSLVNDLGVTLGGNHFLRFDNRSADRAADAIRQARFGAGRRLAHNALLGVAGCGDTFHTGEDLLTNGALRTGFMTSLGAGRRLARNGFFLVAGRRDLFLLHKNFVADGAVLALGLAGLGAGRLDGRVNDLGMALSLNGLALGDFLAADGADCITGVAVLGAGGILLVDHLGERMIVLPLGIKSGVLGQINSRTIRIGVASTIGRRIPVQEVVALAGEGVGRQLRVGLFEHGLSRHRTLDRVFRTAVGFKGNRQLSRLFATPDAVDIVNGVASLGGLRLGVGAVGIVQLGGGDGDGHLFIAICIILIRLGRRAGCALLNVLAGAVAGADIRTALGGVDAANSRYAAVYINLSVFKVCICAVVCLTRRIGHGLKLAGAPDKVVGVPLIAVIEIDILSVCNCQASAFGNVDLNARQQSRVLIDGHISGLDIDGDVIGDGQHIACRVDTHARKL